MVFKPVSVPPANLARDLGQQVAQSIAQELFAGRYKPGDMLPKEMALAQTLGMSRSSVRSGMQTLTALGLIQRRAGHGTLVTESRDWNLLDPLVSQWLVAFGNPNPDILQAIYEYRRAIEPYVSALAALRATAQDLLAMETAFNAMVAEAGAQSQGKTDDFTQADVAFHTAIYRATHNLVWAQSANILRPAIFLVIEKSNETAEGLSDSLERHRRVMEAIRLRQTDAAFDAAVRVLDRTASDLGVSADADQALLSDLMRKNL